MRPTRIRDLEMKMIFLILVAVSVFRVSANAQDIITLKNGDDIQALVQEIGETEIKYKRFDNPNGPNYSIKKSGIFMIRYVNGSKDVFLEEPIKEKDDSILESTIVKNNDNSPSNSNFILKKNYKIIIEPYAFIVGGKKRYTLLQKKLKQMGFCCVFLKNQRDITGGEEDIVIVVHPAGPTTRYHIFDKILDRKVFDEVYGNWSDKYIVNKFIKDIIPFIEK